MKKNWTMRVALLIVALALITSCFVSGTYAKYVTSGSGSDIARVAKFGVTVTATGESFSKTYAKDDASFTLDANTVVSSNDDKLVAPGTKHDVAAVTLTGTPEVAVRVTNSATVTLSGWTLDGTTEYCPIVFKINNVTYGTNDTAATNKYASVEALAAALEAALEETTADYKANTNLSAESGALNVISWEWPFQTGADDTAKAANDIKDTTLGNNAAAGTAAVISIEMTITVTQID